MNFRRQRGSLLLKSGAIVLGCLFSCLLFAGVVSAQKAVICYKDAIESSGLRGSVRLSSGNPVTGVRVAVMDSNWSKTFRATTTNDQGRFTLGLAEPGLYYLQLSKPGFDTIRLKVRIKSRRRTNDELEVRISLSS